MKTLKNILYVTKVVPLVVVATSACILCPFLFARAPTARDPAPPIDSESTDSGVRSMALRVSA